MPVQNVTTPHDLSAAIVEALQPKYDGAKRYNNEFIRHNATPDDLATAIVETLQPKNGEKIYDGAFGSLGLIIEVSEFIQKNEGVAVTAKNLYGREVNHSLFNIVNNLAAEHGLKEGHFYNEDSLKTEAINKNSFDIVISEPPFGLKLTRSTGELGIETSNGTNLFIQHYINSLKEGGRGAVTVTNNFLFASDSSSIELRKYVLENCNLHTILGVPPSTYSYIGIGASVLFFTKGKETNLIKYYDKGVDEDYSAFLDFAISNSTNDRSYTYSLEHVSREDYYLPTAQGLALNKEIAEISKNFNQFKRYGIEDICLEINLTKSEFEEKDYAVYLPKIGNTFCVDGLDKCTLKHQNYFQLVLDKDKVTKGYITYYLRSALGQKILTNCYSGLHIPAISKNSLLKSLDVYVPTIDEQNLISNTFEKLHTVISLMENTVIELSTNPKSAKHILEQLSSTEKAYKELSIEEEILQLISRGEGLQIEFKSTLSYDVNTNKKNKALQESVLKNIVGFLNKNGGTLFIGVTDEGEITGIEKDFYKNDDDYKKKLSNLINEHIGVKESNYIRLELRTIRTKRICLIVCSKALSPAYLNGDFYVRTDPECRKLSAKDSLAYINEHFE